MNRLLNVVRRVGGHRVVWVNLHRVAVGTFLRQVRAVLDSVLCEVSDFADESECLRLHVFLYYRDGQCVGGSYLFDEDRFSWSAELLLNCASLRRAPSCAVTFIGLTRNDRVVSDGSI